MGVRTKIIRNLQNIPGWKTTEKIVVIESDDWGSIRMPSRKIYDYLLNKGYSVDKDPFMKFDSFASVEELTSLIEILSSVKDRHGNNAIMTMNFIMANPAFDKIRETGFSQYYFEPFTKTVEMHIGSNQTLSILKEGITKGVFRPQCHGREHLNVDKWMEGLALGNQKLHEAFNLRMLSISSQSDFMTFGYMEALDYYTFKERENKKIIIQNALDLFESIFGYHSDSFMACCFVWDDHIENELNRRGTKYLQGIARQLYPEIRKDRHRFKHVYHYTGQRNKNNQFYLTRNCNFEPSLKGYYSAMDNCLSEIKTAFVHNKPAIISTHRLNFIGSIDSQNRDRNLPAFKSLLTEILKRWPDVIFMSSDELGNHIKSSTHT